MTPTGGKTSPPRTTGLLDQLELPLKKFRHPLVHGDNSSPRRHAGSLFTSKIMSCRRKRPTMRL